jgi:hypothetical protein
MIYVKQSARQEADRSKNENHSRSQYTTKTRQSFVNSCPIGDRESFRDLITRSFIEGSGIPQTLFSQVAEFVRDTEFTIGGDVEYPIAEALNWRVPQRGQYWQTHKARENLEALLLRNADGTIWQGIISEPDIKDGVQKRAYKYLAPTGGGNRLYFPPVLDWQNVNDCVDVPIILTEGGKKTLAAVGQGYVAIGGYGCQCLAGNEGINPDLLPYAVPGREIVIALDRDTKPKTVRLVNGAIRRLGKLLTDRGCIVRVAVWDARVAKGLDDLLVALGAQGFRETLDRAIPYEQWVRLGKIPLNRDKAVTYSPHDRVRFLARAAQIYRYILDTSAPGSGKSYSVPNFPFEKLTYVSNDHRNPTVEGLINFADVDGKHEGLTLDALGKIRRAGPGDTIVTGANCSRVEAHHRARAKGLDGEAICLTCPLFKACQNSEGKGYGFRKQRKDALLHSKYRIHPASLPDSVEYDYSDRVIVWEEIGTIGFTESITVTQNDVSNLLIALGDRTPVLSGYLKQLWGLFFDRSERWGRGPEKLPPLPTLPPEERALLEQVLTPDFDALEVPDRIDDREFERAKGREKHHLAQINRLLKRETTQSSGEVASIIDSMPSQWLLWLLDGGIPYLHNGQLTITRRNQRLTAIAKSAKSNVFFDATMTADRLALILGVDESEIFVCRAEDPPADNLKINQIVDMGRMGMQRGADQTRRLRALTGHFQAIDPTTKVIDFKKFGADGAWFRDSRGSNDFLDCKTLILVGTPSPNVEAVRSEYLALGGDPAQFQSYYDQLVVAEIIQAIGRLRANRRPGESLTIVLITDFPIDIPGIVTIRSEEIAIEAAPKRIRTIDRCVQAAKQLADQGLKVTQTAVAKIVGLCRATVNRLWEDVKSRLKECISKMLQSDPAFVSPEDAPAVAEIVKTVLNDNNARFIDIAEVFSWLDRRWWDKLLDFLTPEDVEKIATLTLT